MSLKILDLDPWLSPWAEDLYARVDRYQKRRDRMLDGRDSLGEVANGHHYFGFHRTDDGWVYREWAPHASAMHLIGDFNGWDRGSHPMTNVGGGNWEIYIPGRDALPHCSNVKVAVTHDGVTEDRIPLYSTYVRQDESSKGFNATIWAPETPFQWSDGGFEPDRDTAPIIYEAHVGMAVEDYRVGSYADFTENVLPRIKDAGYNTLQLMAVMEHPYYGSFGYQVSSFFAASSRFGTPDELKKLIDEAHRLGIAVLLDVVHSHAVKNTAEGINMFDGTEYQFFMGDHPSWGSKLFDYGNDSVVHFLLSNLKFWMEEYHFDGFRFDGVTSMLYLHHGMETAFMDYSQYFSMATNVDAVSYLMMATALVHEIDPAAICIAEDMSGMPGMCLPIEDGGLGFDYRLNMGLPDYFIKTIKERPDGKWNIGALWHELVSRRPGEKCVAYCESHDQALVGDQTIMFRLAGAEMYTGMRCDSNNLLIERACALHMMTRLLTISSGGDAYLNFMGNEFGHPEWIDFPREGNGWSYHYARRQWSLADDGELRYHWLRDFDKAMIAAVTENKVLNDPHINCLRQHEADQILVFERGELIFAFNFHPSNSQTELFIPEWREGEYRVILSTDEWRFGGKGHMAHDYIYNTNNYDPQFGRGFSIYLPSRTACILKKVK